MLLEVLVYTKETENNQLYAKQIILEGTGLLYQRFEQLKTQLEEMGLFDKMYKKPIPKYATKVGICTASTGAAIQDIINISKEEILCTVVIYIRVLFRDRERQWILLMP